MCDACRSSVTTPAKVDSSDLHHQRHGSNKMNVYQNEKVLRQFGQRIVSKDDGRKEHYSAGFSRLGLNSIRTTAVAAAGTAQPSRANGNYQAEAGCSSNLREVEDEENLLQNLLPGIPDRVTIEGILTKTSWRTLCRLVAVNRAWRQAIQSRRVYKARHYINSAKTLVVASHKAPVPQSTADDDANLTRCGRAVPAQWRYGISLYDPAENSWHRLPPIPGVSSGIPKSCGCVFLNGKLYVIGGDDYDRVHSKRDVYRIDLAGCIGVWEKCASMKNRRAEFPCEVHNGKIYVFGGGYQSEMNYSREAEVYDPVRNEWHPIEDMLHQRTNHTVVTLEGKLFIIGGSVWLEDDDDVLYQRLDCDDMFDSTLHATFAEVYDPWKRSWRKVEKVTKRETDDAFVVVNGKLHVLRPDSVHVYDVKSNSWTFIQHISWEVQACIGAKDCCVCGAAVVNGELVALVGRTKEEDYGLSLLKSKNFYRKNSEVTWEAISCPHEYDSQFFSLFPIQV